MVFKGFKNNRSSSKFLLFVLIQFIVISACGESKKGVFAYPSSQISDDKIADSLYTLALSVDPSAPNYNEALLFRNQYGWQLNKVEQLKSDFPKILTLKEYSGELKYFEIFNPQMYPADSWQQFYEIAIKLKMHFKKGTSEYRENLAILVYLERLLNKDEPLISDLRELIDLLDINAENYFYMLFEYGMTQARCGNELDALTTFEKGFQKTGNADLKSNFATALFNLYSLHKMYDKVLQHESYIISDTSGIALFYLGEAHSHFGNEKLAGQYFELFSSKFQTNEHNGSVYISSGNLVLPVRPIELEVMGDFFRTRNAEKSCGFYNLGIKILSQPNQDFFYKEQLDAIKDPLDKKKLEENYTKNQKEQNELLEQVTKKAKNCKS